MDVLVLREAWMLGATANMSGASAAANTTG